MSTEPTGFNDRSGIPIYRGDLIRVKHYRHYRGRRQMWLYFRVEQIGGKWVVQNWECLNPAKWQCLLADCGIDGSEVLSETGLHINERGQVETFNERPRKRGDTL